MAITNNRLTTEQYEQNFSDIHPPFENKTAALVEANRCLFCYDAPCTKSCPTSINIPKFIKQITTDNIKGSAHTIFTSNIMGAGCSKVCPVEKLCEGPVFIIYWKKNRFLLPGCNAILLKKQWKTTGNCLNENNQPGKK